MPPSPGRRLLVSQHWHGCLPEAPIRLHPSPGPGGVISVLSGTSSSEPPHLQHEEPGAQGCSEENDVMDISFKLDTIASKISSPMFSRETNSTKPGTEPLEKIMNKMSTYNIVAKISTAGKFLQFVNLGKYTDSILFVLDSVPASKRDDARKQAIALLKESAIKSMIEPIFSYLPEKPVNIGDTWETSYFNVSATLSILLLNTHKLEGIENNLARVSGTSEAESMPSTDPAAKMTQELKGTSTFDSTIDLITGLSIRNKSKSHFEGVTKMMNGTTEMVMPMKIDGDTETVISK